ncbi:beta strand repeat-containing protein [Mesorhizobium sp. J8]|uniref:beta strand repeat-containing protein n=1 Tax=Mesorhizobium sp. J8 TaxID=2777475 RepID=UPI0019157FEC|nr:immunoglobulin-like domain-containing protein [Mesorhizobium sp. J8]BCM21656.1 poly(beta-D-mannuronate) C5 epimerase 2 [Mesorhizobium sp. J8]
MSVGDIKVFTINQNGFVLSVQAVDVGGGKTEFVITSLQGKGDLNAIWWSDGDSTVDGNITLAKSDNSLNMNGTGIVWDGYDYLSSAGLGKLGESKSTFISQGETLTYTGSVSLTDISTLGIRATSVNGGDSIKGVDTSADHTYTLPTVSIGDSSVTEGGNAQFTISLSNAYAYDIKVSYGTGDGTAAAGSDYTGTSGYVIIPAGQTTATVTVQTIDDYYKEANETFNVTLSGATTNVLGTNVNVGITDGNGVGTITDDKDTTTITLSAPAAVDEGGSITVTATVDHPPQGDLVIALSNGETITIANGQTSGHVTFAAPADDVYNDGSTLTLGINGTSGGNYEQLDTSHTATVTVHDTTTDATVDLSASTVTEGAAANYVFTATLSNASQGVTTVHTDQGDITIADGQTTGTLTIASGNGEDVYVDASHLTATIVSTSGGNFEHLVVGTGTATANVTDTTTDATVDLSASTVTEGAAANYVFTATLSNASQGVTTVHTDQGDITIADGQTTGTLTIASGNGEDAYVDASHLTATIVSTSGGNFEHLVVGTGTATANVTDTTTDATVDLSASTVTEGAAANYVFTATLSNASQGVTTVHTDQGDITIADGQTTGTLTIASGNGEDVYVDASHLTATIVSTSGGNFEHLVVGTGTATANVTDTIDTTAITLDDVSVNEGAGTATITAHVANAVTGSDLVISLDNGASVTVAVGATSGVSTAFAVADNNVYGDSINYQVGVSGTSGGNFEALDTSDKATVTVHDNDSPPSFSINDVTVSEADGTVTFTVTKTGVTALPATVDYQVAPGTAVAGGDYTAGPDALSATLSFTAGETSKTITLTIVNDAVFEQTEQFYVNLSNPTNATISDSQGVGTITDNDPGDLGGPTGIDFMPTQTGNNALLGHFIQLGDPDATDTFTFSYSATSNNALPASNVTVDSGGNLTANQSNGAVIGDYNVHVTVTDQANNTTSADFHVLVGANANTSDTLSGGSGSDIAAGYNGSDTLSGGAGRDYLLGGQQDDILSGGGGNDVLLGGGGNDQFRMIAPSSNGTDTILDFAVAGHTIGLQQGASSWNAANTIATAAGAGLSASDYQNRNAITNIAVGDTNKVVEIQTAQTNAQIVNGTAGAANAYVAVFNSDTGKGELWYDNNWSDTTGRVHVATLDDVTSLTQLLGLDNSKFIEWT